MELRCPVADWRHGKYDANVEKYGSGVEDGLLGLRVLASRIASTQLDKSRLA
jgi:hypothetical protein